MSLPSLVIRMTRWLVVSRWTHLSFGDDIALKVAAGHWHILTNMSSMVPPQTERAGCVEEAEG